MPQYQPPQTDHLTAQSATRYKLTIAYDGTNFHGWQKQWQNNPKPPESTAASPNDTPSEPRQPLRTVAGVLEQTLQHVFREPIRLVGASRTDTGVHAHGQVAHFDASNTIPHNRLRDAINSRLPHDIEILTAKPTHASFDAISDAVSKRYIYRVFNSPHRPLGRRHLLWHCWTLLNERQMQDAAQRLVGTHDFEGFAAANHGRTTTVRTIFDCQVHRQHPELYITVEGGGFLYNMVRIIAGTLIEVGRGRFQPDVIDRVLASTDRAQAGPTLPPQGLCLQWIRYPDQQTHKQTQENQTP